MAALAERQGFAAASKELAIRAASVCQPCVADVQVERRGRGSGAAHSSKYGGGL